MAGQSDPAGAIDCATVAIAIASDIRGECRVTVQVTAPGGQSSGYAAEDYTCPICLEILLRPIALSCGHRYCRSCWCRMLQGSTIRATAMSTGSVACPLGRCSVRPVVPEVEAALARDLAWRFASQLSGRAAPTEAEEMKMVTEVNEAWAAGCKQVPPPTVRTVGPRAGCKLSRRDDRHRDAGWSRAASCRWSSDRWRTWLAFRAYRESGRDGACGKSMAFPSILTLLR